MDPFSEHGWSAFSPERVAWTMFTVGVLGLLLRVLIVSVDALGDPPAPDVAPPPRAEAPEGAVPRRAMPDRDGVWRSRGARPAAPRPEARAGRCPPATCAAV